MSKYLINSLEKERNFLLTEWTRAGEDEKIKILVKIMDIDEELEANSHLISKSKKMIL